MKVGRMTEMLQWMLTFANTAKDVADWAMKGYEKVPESIKQRLPGFLGLSLDDERIFNGVMSQLEAKKQVIIMKFLHDKCKDFERNRFINIVAGMEVVAGSPREVEKKWNKSTGKFDERVKEGKKEKDRRFDFLDKFADVIIDEFKENLDLAYEFCVGGRMIIPDPIHQRVLRNFSESIGWFKKVVLAPFGAVSVEDLIQKAKQKLSENSEDLNSSVQSFEDRARGFYERSKSRRRS